MPQCDQAAADIPLPTTPVRPPGTWNNIPSASPLRAVFSGRCEDAGRRVPEGGVGHHGRRPSMPPAMSESSRDPRETVAQRRIKATSCKKSPARGAGRGSCCCATAERGRSAKPVHNRNYRSSHVRNDSTRGAFAQGRASDRAVHSASAIMKRQCNVIDITMPYRN